MAVGVVALVGLALVRVASRASGKQTAAGAVAVMMAHEVAAHNWQPHPRPRSGGAASTMNPCYTRSNFISPHVNVNPGQEFRAEWSTVRRVQGT